MALVAVWLAGCVAVPLNYLLSHDELNFIIHDSDIDSIITVPPMLQFIGGPDVIPKGIRILDLQQVDFTGWPLLRWLHRYRRDDFATVLYTSGTSGSPKVVMLTHGNLRSNVDAAIDHANITRADTFLGVLPQFHSFGMTGLTLLPLGVGAKLIYAARFVPRRMIRLIRKHRPNIVMAVPSMYGAFLSVKDATANDFTSIRIAISGGEPLPQATLDAYMNRFNVRLLEGYGLTETSSVANLAIPYRHKPHSMGISLPGVSNLIVDENNQILPPNMNGEILISDPNLIEGLLPPSQ